MSKLENLNKAYENIGIFFSEKRNEPYTEYGEMSIGREKVARFHKFTHYFWRVQKTGVNGA